MTLDISIAQRTALSRRVRTSWIIFWPLVWLRMKIRRRKYDVGFWLLSSACGIRLTRWVVRMLRVVHPVPKGFGFVAPLQADILRDALQRPQDFNGAETMSMRLPAGEVVLGIDWERRHAEERLRLEEAMDAAPIQDAATIRRIVRRVMDDTIGNKEDLSKINFARLFEDIALQVADEYLGVGTESAADRERLRPIIRALASRVFQAPVKNSKEDGIAAVAEDKMRTVVECAARNAREQLTVFPGKPIHERSILQRLLLLVDAPSPSRPDWLTEDWVVRNIATLTVFGSVTSARAMTQALPQMLDQADRQSTGLLAAHYYGLAEKDHGHCETNVFEPDALREARITMRKVVFEALRWHPMLSMLGARTALRDTTLGPGTDAMTRIKAGTQMVPLLLAAMHDGKTFEEPHRFCPFERNAEDFLHFGAGPHECVGRRMAEIQMEEIAYALLRHDYIRNNRIRCGTIKYKGPAVLSLHLKALLAWSQKF